MKKIIIIAISVSLLLLLAAGVSSAWEVYGQVRIYNGTNSSGIGMNGVTVKLDNYVLNIHDSTITATDSAFMQAHPNITSPMGIYHFYDIPYDENYFVQVIPPLGVELAVNLEPGWGWWNSNPRAVGTQPYRCFLMILEGSTFTPHTIGYWKHQATVAVTGQGNAQVPAAQLQLYLNMVYNTFNSTQYFPIQGVSSVNNAPLTPLAMLNTFNLSNKGPSGMVNKAKKQLLALVLNVVSEYVYAWEIISLDDRNVSQAISFGADMISSNGTLIGTAKDAMDYINNGEIVPAGWIPGTYGTIYYGLPGEELAKSQPFLPATEILVGNYPNPFNPTTTIGYQLPEAANVSLRVFDMEGRLVATLVEGWSEAGWQWVNFDGSNLASGVYLITLQTGTQAASSRMILLK